MEGVSRFLIGRERLSELFRQPKIICNGVGRLRRCGRAAGRSGFALEKWQLACPSALAELGDTWECYLAAVLDAYPTLPEMDSRGADGICAVLERFSPVKERHAAVIAAVAMLQQLGAPQYCPLGIHERQKQRFGCPGGGIGRRRWFRPMRRKLWGFEPLHGPRSNRSRVVTAARFQWCWRAPAWRIGAEAQSGRNKALSWPRPARDSAVGSSSCRIPDAHPVHRRRRQPRLSRHSSAALRPSSRRMRSNSARSEPPVASM